MNKIALFITRGDLISKQYAKRFTEIADSYDKIAVGISSCYTHGTQKSALLAHDRERMFRKVLKAEKMDISKFVFPHIQDYSEDYRNINRFRSSEHEERDAWLREVDAIASEYQVSGPDAAWMRDIKDLCRIHGITNFFSGNQNDVLNLFGDKGIGNGVKIVHLTDDFGNDLRASIHPEIVKKAIEENRILEILDMLHPSVVDVLAESNSMEDLLAAYADRGREFVDGRQAIDAIIFAEDSKTHDLYTVLGNRSMKKKDFPGALATPGGGIELFDSPIETVFKECHEETGLKLIPVSLSTNPALVEIKGINGIAKLEFVDLFGEKDPKLSGSAGGSSQVFAVHVICDVNQLQSILSSPDDLDNVRCVPIEEAMKAPLAYQQSAMLKAAYYKTNAHKSEERKMKMLRK